MVKAVSGSGVEVNEAKLTGVEMVSNHPSGGFFGARATGENYRRLLEAHPTHVDPMSSLAGAYMVNFYSYRDVDWNPDFDYSYLHEDQHRYQLFTGIGVQQLQAQ